MRVFIRIVFSAVAIVLANPSQALAVSEGYIHEATLQGWPSFRGFGNTLDESPRHARFWFGCRSVYDGTLLPCRVHFELKQGQGEGALYDGGHRHGGDGVPRPMTYPAGTEPVLRVDGPDRLPDESLRTEIITTEAGPIYWAHPEVAGTQEVSAVMETAPGWVCISLCYTRTIRRFEYKLRIGYEGLEPLPEPGDHYDVTRGDSQPDEHPEGTHGKERTINDIKYLSRQYFLNREGVGLSVNDISLPYGGIFGFVRGQRWNPPHQLHQWGTDIDLNRVDSGGREKACSENEELQKSVRELNKKNDERGRRRATFEWYCDAEADSTIAGNIHIHIKGVEYTPW